MTMANALGAALRDHEHARIGDKIRLRNEVYRYVRVMDKVIVAQQIARLERLADLDLLQGIGVPEWALTIVLLRKQQIKEGA